MKNANSSKLVKPPGWFWPNAHNLLLILLLTLPLSGLVAQLSTLEIGTGNDWVTFGLGNNQDDGHSFSVYLNGETTKGFGFSLILDGVTDQQFSHERYGALALSLSQRLSLRLAPAVTLSLEPAIGVAAAGNLGLEWIQNTLHGLLGRAPVNLPEADQQLRVHPSLSLKGDGALFLGRSSVHLLVSASYTHALEGSLNGAISLEMMDTLHLGGGVSRLYPASDYPSQQLRVQQYSGPYLFSIYDGSLIKTRWMTFPTTGFSYGTFGFDPLAFTREKRFTHADWAVAGGISYDPAGYQTRLASLRYRNAVLAIRYSNGPLAQGSGQRRNIGSWSLGYFTPIGPTTLLFRPTIELYGGFKRFNLVQGFNTPLIDKLRPVIGVEVGLGLGPEDGWIIENQAYHFRLAIGAQHTLFTSSLAAPYEKWEKIAQPWSFLFGLVLEIRHDFG